MFNLKNKGVKMRREFHLLFFISVLFFLCSVSLSAQVKPDLEVTEIFLGTGVENREAIGVDTIFSADVGKLYCWTKITGATTETQISHNWYYQDQEVVKIDIMVKYPSYRCWSIKTIYPEMKGNWRVDIVDAEGDTIGSISFTVR